jgi:hypothetical protein
MRRYTNLFERLVSNTHEPENDQACWFWKCKVDRHCYGRINVYVKGLGTETTLQAHVALWVWLHAEPADTDELWLYYQEFVASGLELDHLCTVRYCVNPDHLEPVTKSVNNLRKYARMKGQHHERHQATPVVEAIRVRRVPDDRRRVALETVVA